MNQRKGSKSSDSKTVSARETAVTILTKLEEKQGFSNLVLQNELKHSQLDVRDKGLVTELVYGTIQRLNTIDYIANHFLTKRTIEKLEPWLRQLLRVAVYQIRYLDKIPDHAIVNEAVELAKKLGHKGIAGFVNGVIRNIIRSPQEPKMPNQQKNLIKYLSLTHSVPEWLIRKWVDDFGQGNVESFLPFINTTAPFTIRYNSLKNSAQAFQHLLDEADIEWTKSSHVEDAYYLHNIGDVSNAKLFQEGAFTIQDESSMLVAKVMAPFPKATVLDGCAAPGGKTTHIAEIQSDEGQILANELHPHKIALIEQLQKRLGIKSIRTRMGDFLEYREDVLYDFVLIDAPCSGLGVVRRKPELKWRMTEATMQSLQSLQRKLIRHAATFVKPGGYLVYSTCTMNRAENHSIVDEFLSEFQEFVGENIKPMIPETVQSIMENQYSIQLLPHHLNSDGFYIAKLKRK